ncbi:LUD domain-containing protein [Hippea maritima]|uniref:Lactate utilization protein B/C n=1 Tax=Hippea maritima (strain ATCC 700847 / DSM 10411 / MH2) TaxID=760142 RepID=F2LVM4_HIPMA|nr:LUD domain-containing protein [Hippea maritima]AEA33808.1 Lactate utilization protein B/C [Hippea maritima DSM 10411]
MKTIEQFKKTASLNGVEVINFEEIEPKLSELGYDGKTHFSKDGVGVVLAISAAASEGNALVSSNTEQELSCLIDNKELYIIINKDDIYPSMYEAYKKSSVIQWNYLMFIGAESKTADIEKQLVSGVQAAERVVFVLR